MRKRHLIVVGCSDLHLTLTAPACRAETDWPAVQARYLKQLRDVAGDVPVLIAGDIFDRWNPPPELIHFALEHLPDGAICVPGQHDLPNHRIEDVHRSGYGVLAKAEKIVDISEGEDWGVNGLSVTGFGWNQTIKPIESRKSIKVALIHRYLWADKKSAYPGAPEESQVDSLKKALRGYKLAITGDNHHHFIAQCGDCTVFNCGTFIRRKSDEIKLRPSVALIYNDGTVERHLLNTSEDRFHEDAQEREEVPLNVQEFIRGLGSLGEHGLDFREAVKNHLRSDDIKDSVKQIILKALETQ